MYKMLSDESVAAFRTYILNTPRHLWPSPNDPEGAFDDMNVFREATQTEKGNQMLTNEWLAGFKAALPSRRRVNPQGAYDQRGGEFERGQAHAEARSRLEECLTELQQFIIEKVSPNDVARANELVEQLLESASSAAEAEDAEQPTVSSASLTEGDPPGRVRMTRNEPPPFRGMPKPGGAMVGDAQSVQLAMDAARSRRERERIWSRRSSSTDASSFAKRWPEIDRIKVL